MKIHVIETGDFKLDGGAMFGVVPKKLWRKLNPPDENNMCTWTMRCLLVEDGEKKILIDTGLGTKQDEKFRSHFHPHGSAELVDSIKKAGFSVDEITDVILTHLHFDHVGGALYLDAQGRPEPTFPEATYWTNQQHYDWAFTPNYREKASFLKENFVPLKDMGRLKYIDVESGVRFSDHLTIDFVYGHTEAMMIPYITLPNGETIVYTADLLPSHCHIGMPYVMSYDIRPLDTLKEKAQLFEKVVNTDHYIMFEHDKKMAFGQLAYDNRNRVVLSQSFELSEIQESGI